MSREKQLKIAVTGGAGFIGRAVIDELSRSQPNANVTTMDLRWPDGPVEAVHCFRGSVLDVDDLSRLLRGADVVVHLAAMLGVERTEEQRLRCLNVNIEGTRTVLDGCVKEGVRKVVFASSSEVYGDVATSDGEKISENSPLNPKSVYAVSKLAGEEYVKAYAKKYGVDYTILRFFNVYGPGQIAEFVVPKFVERAKNGEPLELYGSGEQVRAFCHVHDAARATAMALEHPEADNTILNVGNDQEPVSIQGLADAVAEIADADIESVHVSLEESDRDAAREIYYRVPDVRRARELLNFEPTVSLEQGLNSLFGRARV